jgi:hypothetical protein
MKDKTLNITELLAELVNRGGSIVCSSVCTPKQILAAQRDSRFAATDDGLGFVLKLARKKREVVRGTGSGRFVKTELADSDKIGTVTETV